MGVVPADWIVAACAMVSLLLSGFNFWWLFARPPSLRAGRPTQITFNSPLEGKGPQVVVAVLLYAVGESGAVVETLGVRLRHKQLVKTFAVWVTGAPPVHRAAGIVVDKRGVPGTHFFLTEPGDKFDFEPGEYEVN